MISFSKFYQNIAGNRLKHWLNTLPAQLTQWQEHHLHGEFAQMAKNYCSTA